MSLLYDDVLYGPSVMCNTGDWEREVKVLIDITDHIEYFHTKCEQKCDIKIDWSDPYSEDGARKTWFYVKCPRCRGCKQWTRFRKMYIKQVTGKF